MQTHVFEQDEFDSSESEQTFRFSFAKRSEHRDVAEFESACVRECRLPWSALPAPRPLEEFHRFGDRSLLSGNVRRIDMFRREFATLDEARERPGNIRGLTVESGDLAGLAALAPDLHRLRELRIGWCTNGGVRIDGAFLPDLRALSILNTDLAAFPEWVLRCRSLRKLTIRGAGLSEVPVSISGLSELRSLDLGNNRLQALPSLRGLHRLRELRVPDNEFTSFPCDPEELPRLRFVGLPGNPIPAERRGTIQARLPRAIQVAWPGVA